MMMHLKLFYLAKRILGDAGIESPEVDAKELVYKFLPEDLDPVSIKKFNEAVKKRSEGYPLQYILGEWSFMGCDISVGEGVLIPRDDTEVCVRGLIDELNSQDNKNIKIADLCSGSGCIAIALSKQYPLSDITAIELSDKAFEYLTKNISRNNCNNITAKKDDISLCFDDFEDESFDVIISNPPYICTDEISTLQKEISFEPFMALDGGKDGLYFYRIIVEKWFPKLKKGGIMSLEVGETQAEAVAKLFGKVQYIRILKDIQYLDRCDIIKK